MERPKIRLGICMAGAVSAGAFTAGAMDYLIETLDRWEQLKKIKRDKIKKGTELTADEKLIPDYDVVIEILSGASAGGMTAAVLGYSLLDDSYLNTKNGQLIPENYDIPDAETKKSKLYNCWVNMADEKDQSTLDKLLDTSDVKSITKMNALLNSKAINQIADNALPKAFPSKISYPDYISPDLSIFLTVTNLEGLPVEIKFGNTSDTKNQFKMHSGFLHYSFLKKVGTELDYPSEVLTKDNYSNLILAAKSTGAFPIGLENQKVKILKEFMQKYKENLFANYKLELTYDEVKDGDYHFTAVDGGLINNEPIGTTARFLKNYTPKKDQKHENYLILIDPFPNITNADEEPKPVAVPNQYNLIQIIAKLFGAVRDQSMFKQEDLLEGLNMENNKYLIYPSKKGYYFLACGLIGGFSGFLKKAFREHDYQLGRKNCQTFLRYYFGENMEHYEGLGLEFTDDQKEMWGYYPNQDKKQPVKMPLIPDMLYISELSKNKNYVGKSRGDEVTTPHYDGLEKQELEKILSKIRTRLSKIIDESFSLVTDLANGFLAKTAIWLFKGKIKDFAKDKSYSVVANHLTELFKPQFIKQDVLVRDYVNTIASKGKSYRKIKGVTVKIAVGGEFVETKTSDGHETTNIAGKGDYIVTNDTQAQEVYIVSKNVFERDYEVSDAQKNYYVKREQIYALPFTKNNFSKLFEATKKERNANSHLYIEASWKESQVLREDDYLVCNKGKTEIYRIAKKEFEETYKAVS